MTKKIVAVIIASLLLILVWLFFVSNQGSDLPESPQTPESPEDIVIHTPKEGETVSFPLEIQGEARGSRFFEANFPVRILGEDGMRKLDVYAEAEDNWMTEDFVPFTITITDLDFQEDEPGTIIFNKANPSGLPQGDVAHYLFVKFPNPDDYTEYNFYWPNADSINEGGACDEMVRSTRLIRNDADQISEVIKGLLDGPSQQETLLGMYSSIPRDTQLLSVTLQDGELELQFTADLDKDVAGSCLVTSIRTQIERTAMQFLEVDSVQLRVENRTNEEVLQP